MSMLTLSRVSASALASSTSSAGTNNSVTLSLADLGMIPFKKMQQTIKYKKNIDQNQMLIQEIYFFFFAKWDIQIIKDTRVWGIRCHLKLRCFLQHSFVLDSLESKKSSARKESK
jgi:hypothetical protein